MTEDFSLNQYLQMLSLGNGCPSCGATVHYTTFCEEGYVIHHLDATQATCVVPWSAHPMHIDISDLQEGTDAIGTE